MNRAESAAPELSLLRTPARPLRGQQRKFSDGLGLAIVALTLAGTADARDLLGVYEDALQSDPQLRGADANRLASRESRPQALAAFWPRSSVRPRMRLCSGHSAMSGWTRSYRSNYVKRLRT